MSEFESITQHKHLYDFVKSRSETGKLNFVLIDEVQMIPEFERALRSLLAEGDFDIYCTGSNAHLLSGELGTYLGGRYIEIPVHSLNYNEFIQFHKLNHSSESLNKYLKFGGLPYLIHLEFNDDILFDYLKNINQSILFRDVVSRFQVRNVENHTKEREFGNLLAIKDNFPKYVITMDDYYGASHEGIQHIPLNEFLHKFK